MARRARISASVPTAAPGEIPENSSCAPPPGSRERPRVAGRVVALRGRCITVLSRRLSPSQSGLFAAPVATRWTGCCPTSREVAARPFRPVHCLAHPEETAPRHLPVAFPVRRAARATALHRLFGGDAAPRGAGSFLSVHAT